MNPFTWLYRRSRLFRGMCCLLIILVTLFIWMVADDQFAHYTQVGDLTVLFGFTFFAAWPRVTGTSSSAHASAKKIGCPGFNAGPRVFCNVSSRPTR